MILLFSLALLAISPLDPVAAEADAVVARSNATARRRLSLPEHLSPALYDSILVANWACDAEADLGANAEANAEHVCSPTSWPAYHVRSLTDDLSDSDVQREPWKLVDVSRAGATAVARLRQELRAGATLVHETATITLALRDGVVVTDNVQVARTGMVSDNDNRAIKLLCNSTEPDPLLAATKVQLDPRNTSGLNVVAYAKAKDRATILSGLAHTFGLECPYAKTLIGAKETWRESSSIPPLPGAIGSKPPPGALLDAVALLPTATSYQNTEFDIRSFANEQLKNALKTLPECAKHYDYFSITPAICGPTSIAALGAVTRSEDELDIRDFGPPRLIGAQAVDGGMTVAVSVRLHSTRLLVLQEWVRRGGRWLLHRVLVPPPSNAFEPVSMSAPRDPELVTLCASPKPVALTGNEVLRAVAALPAARQRAALEAALFLGGIDRCPAVSAP
jgi:hypothetical protein